MLGWGGLISEQSKETHAEHARRRGLSKQVGVKALAPPLPSTLHDLHPLGCGLRAHRPDPADSPMRRPLACFLTARSHPVGRGEDTQRGGTAPPLPPDPVLWCVCLPSLPLPVLSVLLSFLWTPALC